MEYVFIVIKEGERDPSNCDIFRSKAGALSYANRQSIYWAANILQCEESEIPQIKELQGFFDSVSIYAGETKVARIERMAITG